MAMTFKFEVVVTVDRVQGKFASRDEISEAIRSELEGADPGYMSGLGADGNSDYETTDFEVNDL